MTIQERIEQLERRLEIELLNTIDKVSIKGQIQALKWVQAERNREFKDFLKETRGWEKETTDIRWVEQDRFTGNIEPIDNTTD